MKKDKNNNNNKNDKVENQEVEKNVVTNSETEKIEDNENIVKTDNKVKGRGFFSSKKFIGGSISIVVVVLALVLFFAVNILSVKVLDDTLKLSWDLTTTKKYSFTKESKDFLKKLKQDVTIYCLFNKNDKSSKLAQYKDEIEFIGKYEEYDNVKVVYKDPEKYPNVIKEVDPKSTIENIQYSDIIIKSDKRLKKIGISELTKQSQDQMSGATSISYDVESVMTNGINYVSKKKVPSVYFLSGHGELGRDSEVKAFGQFVDSLGFLPKDLNLLKDEPKKGDVVVVVSPKKDISDDEVKKLKSFMDNGGKMVTFFAPIANTKKLDNFDKLLKDYNLALDYDLVKEKETGNYADKDTYPVPNVQDHAVTTILNQSQGKVILTESRSIQKLNDNKEGLTVTPILVTSDKAIGESYINNEKINGPLNLGVVAENSNNGSKLLVLGNSQFITDTLISQTNGGAIIYGAMQWINDEKDEINIEPKVPEATQVTLTRTQIILFYIGLLVVIPLLIIGTGVFIWLRRRHL